MAACVAYTAAESAFAKENAEGRNALLELDQPYSEARAVVLAYHPTTKLPETLKSLPTDTDRKNAIQALLDVIDNHAGAAWADTLLAGPLGTNAAKVIQELDEAITANTAFAKARDRRATAYGLAYERYLAFKNVVRNACGPRSKEYRFIHLRSDPKGDPPTGGGDDEG